MEQATEQVSTEPKFTLQRQGERRQSAPIPLSELLAANAEDPDVCEWAQRAGPNSGLITGGGAAPITTVRRVA